MFTTPLVAGLLVLGTGLLLELIALLVRMRQVRRVLYIAVLLTASSGGTLVFIADPGILSFLVAAVAAYRAINAMRVVAERMHLRHAQQVTSRSSRYLGLYQLITIAVLIIDGMAGIEDGFWLLGSSAAALLAAVFIAFTAHGTLKRSKIRPSDKYASDASLPTVSVCIPARNETEDLPDCLTSIIASDYPKLEILVLDDCSQDRTSEIIRGFAQDGVRFIAGSEPKKGWLAKNQAYQSLAEAASGELLLFCGVDARFGKGTIRSLVGTLTARKKQMISVMPQANVSNEHASLIQPMRYWWELALPRRLFNRPPVLSTTWLISKEAMEATGGFGAVNNTVVPEAYFAKSLAHKDEYSFMRSSGALDVRTAKQLNDQWETAIRVRYPQLRKRPESVLLLSMAEIWLLFVPVTLFISGFFVDFGMAWVASGVTVSLMLWVHWRILRAWNVRDIGEAMAAFPVAVCLELYVLHLSMLRYEFSQVRWKDRNVCIPVMHAVPRLPKI